MANTPFIDAGKATKGFDFSPWGGIEGFLRASKTGAGSNHAVLKRLVPDLAKGVNMTAVAVSSLPFDILWDNGSVFDTSADWKNKLGGMDNPQKMLYLVASALCGGAAYVLPMTTERAIFQMQYLAPHTIRPYIDRDGLQYFDRSTDRGKTERLSPQELIYFWLPDSDVEIGPAENHPLINAAIAAELIFNMSNVMKIYGERGFVPITLLGASGMPNPADREKSEKFFDRLLRGGFDVLAKIVNSDALTLIRVGAGMDELKQSYIEIKREAKEGIADSFGIPTALFMSDNAFASEFDALRKQWYTASRFVSLYQTIQEVFSEQLLKNYGKKMRFNIEALDIFQEDESKRSDSLSKFVTAVTTDPSVAKLGMSIMGYDLDQTQKDMLEKAITDKEEAKVQEQEMAAAQMEQDAQMQPEALAAKPQPGKKPAPKPKSFDLTADELKDLSLWYSKAKAWHAKGKGNAVDWENKSLREEVAAPIRLKLAEARTEYDIMQAFQLGDVTETPAPEYSGETHTNTDAIKALVAVIERAIEATKAEPTVTPSPVFNMTMPSISLTAQMPEAGTVNVNVPEQPAPVVNVTNQVNPTPVRVENNVQPAEVTVIPEGKKKVDLKVKRDAQGKIESAQGKIG